MCVIIIDPNGKELDFKILQNAVERNPHGWGLATQLSNKIHITKGFGFAGAKRAWKRNAGRRRVFHARVATSGAQDIKNCHPFEAGTVTEPRWFFHNGTVNIPRFNASMCDSWHLARFVREFEWGDMLDNAIQDYAIAQNSRFTLVRPGEFRWYGKGWIERDGFIYSNGSALCDIKTSAHGYRTFSGGLLTDTAFEVTSDMPFDGSFYDSDRKLHTNIKPANHFTNKPDYWEQKEAQRKADEAAKALGPKANTGTVVPLRLGNISLGSDEEGLSEEHLNELAVWQGKVLRMLMKAPWMRNDLGYEGVLRSYPNANGFDYGFLGLEGYSAHCLTYRVFLPRKKAWLEIVFDKGVYKHTIENVNGPYVGGSIIRMGTNVVTYGSRDMHMSLWRDMVISTCYPTLFKTRQENSAFLQQLESKFKGDTVTVKKDDAGYDIIVINRGNDPYNNGFCC